MTNSKKNLIKKSAISVFAKEGYYHTSVKQIAEKADVSVGTVYNYFANKENILEYIFEVELKKRLGWLRKLREEKNSLKEQFVEFMDRHFSELESDPDTTAVLMQECRPPSHHELESIKEFGEQLPVLFAEMIEEAKESGEIKEIDSELIATAIFEAFYGVSRKIYEKGYDFEKAKEEMVNFYWSGFKK